MGKVILSPNITKTSERLDFNGNVIDPRTKQILVPREIESILPPSTTNTPYFVPPPEAIAVPLGGNNAKDDGLSVLQQIEATKQRLKELEELKKLKIAEKEAELELLKNQ